MTKSRKKREQPEFTFDCMAWLEGVQAEIHEEIKDMTREEEFAYWRKAAEKGPLGKRWREVHQNSQVVRESPPQRSEGYR